MAGRSISPGFGRASYRSRQRSRLESYLSAITGAGQFRICKHSVMSGGSLSFGPQSNFLTRLQRHNQRYALETRDEIETAHRGNCSESGSAGSSCELACGFCNADGRNAELLYAVYGARDYRQDQVGSWRS